MRNAAVIDAISAKIAARLSEAQGAVIPVITAADIERDPDALLGYCSALSADALEQLGYRDVYSLKGIGVPEDSPLPALGQLAVYVQESSWPIEGAGREADPEVGFDRPGEGHLSAEEAQARTEDWELSQIHPAYLPHSTVGSRDELDAAEDALAWSHRETMTPEQRKHILGDERWRSHDHHAERYAPADFVSQSADHRTAAAERALAGWAALREQRDNIVKQALAAGVTKSRIQQITGISRSTIDRIPGV